MKKILFILTSLSLLLTTPTLAQSRTSKGLTEAEKLAITAGAAQACGADTDKLKNYEVIASRILVNQTATEKEETAALTAYARKKFEVYSEQKKAPEMYCSEVLNRFDNLPIFQSTVYQDGTLKLPDGKIIKPIRPLNQTKPVNVKRTKKELFKQPKKSTRSGVIINKQAS